MSKRTAILIAAVAALCLLASGCEKLKARDNLNKGVQAYKNAQYPQAVEFFKTAVELDPNFPTARLYLATAYMSQYIPGAESPENLQMAQAAHEQFNKVLAQDPKNEVAIASIASLYFNQKKFEEAEEWNKKLIEVNPKSKEAYYTLAVIAWTNAWKTRMEARAKLGMKPEDPGPIKDKKVRVELKEKNEAMVREGIQHIQKALEIDPEYDDAMAYANLLHREIADIADTQEEYKKETEIADDFVQKALETKKIKAERKPAGGGITTE
jgi:tetratricopeptide (TPR) repeat protein